MKVIQLATAIVFATCVIGFSEENEPQSVKGPEPNTHSSASTPKRRLAKSIESASGSTVSKESPVPYSQEELNHLLRGLSGALWVNEGYLSKVKTTRSLPKSANYPMPVLQFMDHSGHGDCEFEIQGPAPGFHEGGAYRMDICGARKVGKYIRLSLILSNVGPDLEKDHLRDGDPALKAFIEFQGENPERFVYVHGKTKRTFQRFKNSEDWESLQLELNRFLVAGKYKDRSGKIYSFSESMFAVFPEKGNR